MPDQNSLINLQYQFSIVNDLNIEIKKLKEKISDNSQIIETEQLMQPVTEKFNSLTWKEYDWLADLVEIIDKNENPEYFKVPNPFHSD